MKRITHLQSGVDGKGTSSRIHTGHVLSVVDFFQRQFGSVIPMFVVNVLPHESMRLHREVLIHLYIHHYNTSLMRKE